MCKHWFTMVAKKIAVSNVLDLLQIFLWGHFAENTSFQTSKKCLLENQRSIIECWEKKVCWDSSCRKFWPFGWNRIIIEWHGQSFHQFEGQIQQSQFQKQTVMYSFTHFKWQWLSSIDICSAIIKIKFVHLHHTKCLLGFSN